MSNPETKDFFISYNRYDKQWAEWIAWTLEESGYTVIIQAWDFRPGGNFVLDMQNAASQCQKTIAVLSENYLQSAYTQPEWSAAFAQDPKSLERKMIPVRVAECQPTGMLAPIVYIDLVGVAEDAAAEALLGALKGRAKPAQKPLFPGSRAQGEATATGARVISEPVPFPVVEQGAGEPPLKLAIFEFEVVTVDKTGKEISRNRQEAEYFTERLDDHTVLEMVKIPGGMFTMGSPEGEEGRIDWEGPQHLVRIAQPFFMGKYPITQAQWFVVAHDYAPINRELNPDPSKFKGPNRPVEQVNWHEAVEFCDRLSQRTGRQYRLPSEAEWEYACRAGTTTPFHFGETVTPDLANYNGTDDPGGQWSGSYGRGPKGVDRNETTPIGHFGVANAFGLYDMHGNVEEWCEDRWHRNYGGAPSNGSAWLKPEVGKDVYCVLRGGSWFFIPRLCRSASRINYVSGSRDFSYGFRVVCLAPRTL